TKEPGSFGRALVWKRRYRDWLAVNRRKTSVVAIDPLAPLVPFLRLDRERGNGPRLQPAQRNRLAGLLAVAVSAVFDAAERLVDLGDQLALAIARAQLDGTVGFGRRPVGEVGMILVLLLQMQQGLFGFLEDVLTPDQQLHAEILPLPLVHKRLFVGRPVAFGLRQH